MTPNHIRTEVQRRIQLADEISPEVIQALGIDPTALPEDREEPLKLPGTGPELPGESAPTSGHIPFELTLSALGESVTHSCRASYAVTLYDDEHPTTGQLTRIMGSLVMRYELLDWDDPEECDEDTGKPSRLPTPRWRRADLFPLIPRAIETKLDDLIEEQALSLERAQIIRG